MSGLSWFALLSTTSLPPLSITHASRCQKRPIAAFLNSSFSLSKPPNELLMASCNGARRSAARVRPHDVPEHRVVDVTTTVVGNGRADVFRHRVDARQQILDALVIAAQGCLSRAAFGFVTHAW